MAKLTMTEALKYVNDQVVAGVAEEIVSVDELMGVLPVYAINGSSVTVNGETTAGDVEELAVNAAISAVNASGVTSTVFNWTAYVGDAIVDRQVIAAAGSAANPQDLLAREIISKAGAIGRKVKADMGKGTATRGIKGFHQLASVNLTGSARNLSLDLIDELLDTVKSGTGRDADFIVSTSLMKRKAFALMRALGGATPEFVQLDNGRRVPMIGGTYWFVNDELPDEDTGSTQSIYAGLLDDGSQKVGLGLIHPNTVPAGVEVEDLGASQGYFARQARVSMMVGNALFNQKALVRLADVNKVNA